MRSLAQRLCVMITCATKNDAGKVGTLLLCKGA